MSRESAIEAVTDRIHELHELSFHYLDEKKNGAESVPMEAYEYLINHYIEHIQDTRDALMEFGDKYYCGKCSVEVKGKSDGES
jgi:hypothetical protein